LLLAEYTGDNSVVARYEFAPGKGNAEQAVQAMIEARDDPMKVIDAIFLAMNDVGFAAEFLVEARKQGLGLPLYGKGRGCQLPLLHSHSFCE
jgi:hypothetical protein